MPGKSTPDDELIRCLRLLEENDGNVSAAARAAGIPRGTFTHRTNAAAKRGLTASSKPEQQDFAVQMPPADDLPAEKIIETLCSRFEKRLAHHEATRWRRVDVNIPGPFGLVWLGDPHLDDNGCHWPILLDHIKIIQSAPYIRGCSLGDNQNAWVGRLAKLYANQDTSAATANKLVEWLIHNMDPLVMIGGNHDMWLGQGDPTVWFAQKLGYAYQDWRANIEFRLNTGKTLRVVAAHDLPGHSMWNPLHAQIRAAQMDLEASVYLSGHRHTSGLFHVEYPNRQGLVWLARARGYKYLDSYARDKGYQENQHGQAIFQIIDPHATSQLDLTWLTMDVELGADYLKFIRKRRGFDV